MCAGGCVPVRTAVPAGSLGVLPSVELGRYGDVHGPQRVPVVAPRLRHHRHTGAGRGFRPAEAVFQEPSAFVFGWDRRGEGRSTAAHGAAAFFSEDL